MTLPPRPRLSQIQRPVSANRSTSSQSQPQSQPKADPSTLHPEVAQIPERIRSLEPADPPIIAIQDPVFDTPDAAAFLGLKSDRLEKWRQRGMGPDYLRYPNGYVRYELSGLNDFKARHRIRPSRERHQVRRPER